MPKARNHSLGSRGLSRSARRNSSHPFAGFAANVSRLAASVTTLAAVGQRVGISWGVRLRWLAGDADRDWVGYFKILALFHRAAGEACHEPVDEKIIDDGDRHARDQAGAHHRAPEINIAAHEERRNADTHRVAR